MSMNPRRVGKYELQQRLAGGAMGEVWKAWDTQQHRYVAIKVITVNAQDSADFTSRFTHEAQILTTLRHPNIVAVQDFRMIQGGSEAYIIMDYVEGSSLADYLKTTAHAGNIPAANEIVHLLSAIASAIDYALQRGVIHGALRPAAILLDRTNVASSAPGEPKLTDFGLNFLRNPLAFSLDDMPYISPEVASGQASTNRSDVYSLGAILYEMCTGALPFSGDTPGDILMQHIHGTPTSPALINPHIPPALTAAIMRGLARDPAARFPSATALATAVANGLNVSVPESMRQSRPLAGGGNPSSLSGISGSLNTTNSPTSPAQWPQQPAARGFTPVPQAVASGNTPVPPPPPVIPSSTPMLPRSFADSTAGIPSQTEMNLPTLLTPTPSRTTPTSAPVPVAAISSPPLPAPAHASPPPPAAPAPPARRKRPRGLYLGLVAAVLVVLIGSTFGIYRFIGNTSSTQSPVVGHAFFVSSGLLSSENSNRGISDGLQINLQNLPPPANDKSYYGWLWNSKQSSPIFLALGSLPLNHGQVTMTYTDPNDNNLLATYNSFLVTEESTNPAPTVPSTDTSTWRYYAAFATTPNPTDPEHFSVYDHLQHLLALDPKLAKVNLSGGLDIWLFRNTEKILEQAGSARDAEKQCAANPNSNAGSCEFVHRDLVRILDYLDGSQFVGQDVHTGPTVLIDPTIAKVALLEFDTVKQFPPGYLVHIGTHLREIVLSPGVTAEQRTLAIHISQDINNVQVWMIAVRHDAAQLVQMNNSQLASSTSIINDLFTNANYAFVGKYDPNTGTVKEGVVQIHYNIQGLATFNVTPCTVSNGQNSCA